jgi:hypothetical protein
MNKVGKSLMILPGIPMTKILDIKSLHYHVPRKISQCLLNIPKMLSSLLTLTKFPFSIFTQILSRDANTAILSRVFRGGRGDLFSVPFQNVPELIDSY